MSWNVMLSCETLNKVQTAEEELYKLAEQM